MERLELLLKTHFDIIVEIFEIIFFMLLAQSDEQLDVQTDPCRVK